MQLQFQSTLPARGATAAQCAKKNDAGNFNPRSPHGERLCWNAIPAQLQQFQSTLPARGATVHVVDFPLDIGISIHAPRTGSDFTAFIRAAAPGISIHAPRTGSDHRGVGSRHAEVISIHAPRTGSDCRRCRCAAFRAYFNPRSPHGERPAQSIMRARGGYISIHAPRTGSDIVPSPCCQGADHFNPRSPHGERPWCAENAPSCVEFQSTLPARGATPINADTNSFVKISIHAPRTGSDVLEQARESKTTTFQSTLPARGATER